MRTSEINADSQQAIELARVDFNFLAGLISPQEFRYAFPPFYLMLFSLLTSFKQPIERYALGIPRGFAKTTWVKILCVWLILFSDKKFILIVGASEKLALNTVADICDFLSSANIVRLFGDYRLHMEEDTKEQKVFYFRGRDIILKGIGAETSVRGINRKSSRPDVILLDDVQKKEDAEGSNGAELASNLLSWVLGTLGLARSNDGCTYIYIGNMYPQNCILDMLRKNSAWTSFIVGGILADGTSLWEELKPIESLLEDYTSLKDLNKEDIFLSEILNHTGFRVAHGLDLARIPICPEYYLATEPEGSFILIDPSAGKKTSDDLTLEHYSVVDGKPILDDVDAGTFTPLETIEKALALGFKHNTRLICVEDVAYQGTLLFWFNHYCELHGISGFEFHPTTPKGRNKNNRIKKGALKVIAGEILLAPSVRSRVVDQYTEWDPLTVNNRDDIIDPIGYVEEVMQEYPEFIVKQIFDMEEQSLGAAHTGDLLLPGC